MLKKYMLQRLNSASFSFKAHWLEVPLTLRPRMMSGIRFSAIFLRLRSRPVQQNYRYFFKILMKGLMKAKALLKMPLVIIFEVKAACNQIMQNIFEVFWPFNPNLPEGWGIPPLWFFKKCIFYRGGGTLVFCDF